jgi:hypothetical protein
MRIRKATLEKVQSLKDLMLRGWSINQSLKHLHMSQNTYRKKCWALIWQDQTFVQKLLKFYERPPKDFLRGRPQDEREALWFLLHVYDPSQIENLHKQAKEKLEKEPVYVIKPKTNPKAKLKIQQKLMKEKVRRLAELLKPINIKNKTN